MDDQERLFASLSPEEFVLQVPNILSSISKELEAADAFAVKRTRPPEETIMLYEEALHKVREHIARWQIIANRQADKAAELLAPDDED